MSEPAVMLTPVSVRACQRCDGSMEGRATQARYCSVECTRKAQRQRAKDTGRKAEQDRAYREKNLERLTAYAAEWRALNRERLVLQSREHYAANRERVLEQQREYRARTAEERRAASRDYYRRNRQRIAEQTKLYRAANRERRRLMHAAWRNANREAYRERQRAWKAGNPEKARESARLASQKRRALRGAGAVGEVTMQDARRLFARHPSCAYCEVAPSVELDHVVPLSRGGAHSIGNLLPVCGTCNRQKAGRLLTEWRRDLRRLNERAA